MLVIAGTGRTDKKKTLLLLDVSLWSIAGSYCVVSARPTTLLLSHFMYFGWIRQLLEIMKVSAQAFKTISKTDQNLRFILTIVKNVLITICIIFSLPKSSYVSMWFAELFVSKFRAFTHVWTQLPRIPQVPHLHQNSSLIPSMMSWGQTKPKLLLPLSSPAHSLYYVLYSKQNHTTLSQNPSQTSYPVPAVMTHRATHPARPITSLTGKTSWKTGNTHRQQDVADLRPAGLEEEDWFLRHLTQKPQLFPVWIDPWLTASPAPIKAASQNTSLPLKTGNIKLGIS